MARSSVWRWSAAFLTATLVLLALGEASGWPFLRRPMQQALASATGVPVTLDPAFRMRLLWRPMLQVDHLNIAAGAGVDAPYLLDAHRLDMGWRWLDLWQWRRGAPLRLQRLHADRLQLHLVRAEDGRASWQFGRAAEPQARDEALPRFGSLRVHEGQIRIDDVLTQTRLQVVLQGGEGEQAAPQATGYRMSVDGSYRGLPLALKLQSGGALPLLQDPRGASPSADVPLRIEGQAGATRLLFDGSAGALLGDRRLQGALRLRGPSLAQVGSPLGLVLPQTPPFDLKAQLSHASGVWHLQAERGAIGSSLLNGDFRLDTRTQPPRLQGRLGGRRLSLADLGPAVGVPQGNAASAPRERVLPQRRFDLPSLRDMDADVQVAIDELDFGSDALNPLLDLRTQLRLQGGVLQLQEMRAHVAGGRFRGMTVLDANVEPARWTVDVRFGTVDIAGWVAGLRPDNAASAPARQDSAALQQQRRQARSGAEQPVQSYLTGALSGAVQASGRGRSVAEILGSLDGRAQLMLREGTLSHLATEAVGLDVAEALGVLVSGDRPLPLRCAWLDLALQDGVVQPQLAVLDNDDTEVRATGTVNLRDESLALRLVARPKDISPFTLRTPVTLGGTLASPDVGIETGRLAGKALGAVALGAAIGPLAALLPFVDLGVGNENDACAAKPPAPPRPAGASQPAASSPRARP
jgi:AsmA family protein